MNTPKQHYKLLNLFESNLMVFQTALSKFQLIYDKIGSKESIQKWADQLKDMARIVDQFRAETSGINFKLILNMYCYSVCLQYELSKKSKTLLKSRSPALIQWKDKAPIFEGGINDTILQLFNDIYRHSIEIDTNLFEVRSECNNLGTYVPDEILTELNNKVCDKLPEGTLKYRLANMLRFFSTLGRENTEFNFTCPKGKIINLNSDSVSKLHWSEQLFTHHLYILNSECIKKPEFTQKNIIINNKDSPLIYYNITNTALGLRKQLVNSLQYLLRESSKYNQHGLTHVYGNMFINPENKANTLDLLNKLDYEITKLTEKKTLEDKKGINAHHIKNQLKYFHKTIPDDDIINDQIKLVPHPDTTLSPKYSMWLETSCGYFRICDTNGTTEWDDLSDVPNYIPISNLLKNNVVDGGFIFNKYLESLELINKQA
jgi:hypothetical protein